MSGYPVEFDMSVGRTIFIVDIGVAECNMFEDFESAEKCALECLEDPLTIIEVSVISVKEPKQSIHWVEKVDDEEDANEGTVA